MPSWLVKENLPTMLPVITKIVNASLASGVFPSRLKHSIIKPVIKKSTMDPNSLKSYRPVANITFLSKVVEKAVTCQVTDYVDSNCLGEQHQSAYRPNHSTETALLKVNDFLQSLDKVVLRLVSDLDFALLEGWGCFIAIGAPKIWNELPTEIREAESVFGFKRMLKTHLYPD
ncbi:uncharacterized protein [Amphiura filiformis]|uniref:uncharacterized protein n=1 Tax=Amphiura filiformis TaxID=82378 RepID=UPI003B223374